MPPMKQTQLPMWFLTRLPLEATFRDFLLTRIRIESLRAGDEIELGEESDASRLYLRAYGQNVGVAELRIDEDGRLLFSRFERHEGAPFLSHQPSLPLNTAGGDEPVACRIVAGITFASVYELATLSTRMELFLDSSVETPFLLQVGEMVVAEGRLYCNSADHLVFRLDRLFETPRQYTTHMHPAAGGDSPETAPGAIPPFPPVLENLVLPIKVQQLPNVSDGRYAITLNKEFLATCGREEDGVCRIHEIRRNALPAMETTEPTETTNEDAGLLCFDADEAGSYDFKCFPALSKSNIARLEQFVERRCRDVQEKIGEFSLSCTGSSSMMGRDVSMAHPDEGVWYAMEVAPNANAGFLVFESNVASEEIIQAVKQAFAGSLAVTRKHPGDADAGPFSENPITIVERGERLRMHHPYQSFEVFVRMADGKEGTLWFIVYGWDGLTLLEEESQDAGLFRPSRHDALQWMAPSEHEWLIPMRVRALRTWKRGTVIDI